MLICTFLWLSTWKHEEQRTSVQLSPQPWHLPCALARLAVFAVPSVPGSFSARPQGRGHCCPLLYCHLLCTLESASESTVPRMSHTGSCARVRAVLGTRRHFSTKIPEFQTAERGLRFGSSWTNCQFHLLIVSSGKDMRLHACIELSHLKEFSLLGTPPHCEYINEFILCCATVGNFLVHLN